MIAKTVIIRGDDEVMTFLVIFNLSPLSVGIQCFRFIQLRINSNLLFFLGNMELARWILCRYSDECMTPLKCVLDV